MIGRKVVWSDEAKRNISSLRKPDRHGVIVGESRDQTCWIVRWHGNRPSSKDVIHKDYLVVLEQDE